tara:strand:+ start:193 stop:726 length:534 start_codon:yes stop_codon:yes gene_type:complete
MSDSIKNKITSAAQISGYKTVAHGGLSVATHEVDYINIPWGAIVTDVVVIPTTAFVHSSGTTHVLAGPVVGYAQADGSAASVDTDGYLVTTATTGTLGTKGKKINTDGRANASAAGVLLGTAPAYSLSETYGSNGEEKVSPVALQFVNSTDTSTAGEIIWWVEYMFPANIVWLQTSL